MTATKEFAEGAAQKAATIQHAQDGTFEFDPAIIFVIIEVIQKLIEMIQDCRKEPAEAAEMANNPNMWQRLVIKIQVRREIGRRAYRQHGDAMVQGILEEASMVTEAQAEQMLEEL